MRLVDAEFEEKHYLSMVDNPTPDVSENDRKTALAIVKAFRLASTVEERKTGKWILVKGSNGKDYHMCSECLHTQDITGVKNYCSVCGADMRGEKDENTKMANQAKMQRP